MSHRRKVVEIGIECVPHAPTTYVYMFPCCKTCKHEKVVQGYGSNVINLNISHKF